MTLSSSCYEHMPWQKKKVALNIIDVSLRVWELAKMR